MVRYRTMYFFRIECQVPSSKINVTPKGGYLPIITQVTFVTAIIYHYRVLQCRFYDNLAPLGVTFILLVSSCKYKGMQEEYIFKGLHDNPYRKRIYRAKCYITRHIACSTSDANLLDFNWLI